MPLKSRLSYAALSFIIIANSAPAWGQGVPDDQLQYVQPRPGLFHVPEKYQRTYVDVGGGIVSLRAYQGSDKQNTNFYPFASAEYKGRYFANPFNGVGVYVMNSKKYNLSTSVTYNPGRKAADTPFDFDSFDQGAGVSLKASGRIRFKYMALGATGRLPVAGDVRGVRGSFRAATLLPIGKQIRVVPSVALSYEDGKRLTNVYGVNQAQALDAGLQQLSYDGGFSGYSTSIAAYWRSKDKKVQVLGGVTYRELIGDITESPLTPDDNSFLLGVGLARRY